MRLDQAPLWILFGGCALAGVAHEVWAERRRTTTIGGYAGAVLTGAGVGMILGATVIGLAALIVRLS